MKTMYPFKMNVMSIFKNSAGPRLLLSLTLLLFIPVLSQAQELNLNGFWKFHRGDSLQWKMPGYNDRQWVEIPVGVGWEEVDENFDGFAWYRLAVTIPSQLKKKGSSGLELYINRINDADQTFLNGELVGVTDNPYQPDMGPSFIQRRYFIPFVKVRWDQVNVFAVRVFNIKNDGGIYSGPVLLRPLPVQYFAQANDEIVFKAQMPESVKQHSKPVLKVAVLNNGKSKLAGTVELSVVNTVFKPAMRESFAVDLESGKEAHFSANLPAEFCGAFRVYAEFTATDGSEKYLGLGVYLVNTDHKPTEAHPFQGYLNGPVPPVIAGAVLSAFECPAFEDQSFSGYLKWRMDVNLEKRLLKTDTTFLLTKFRKRGYLSDGKPYDGEHMGKFFHTGCNTWLLTKNEPLAGLMHETMKKWLATQLPDGYLGTYLANEQWSDWDVWVHKYDLIGLLSYYKAFNSQEAMQAAVKIGDLLVNTFGDESGKPAIEKTGRHVGLASMSVLDPMVELYRLTGDPKYLTFCRYIVKAYENQAGPKLFSTLMETGSVKKTANAKAYEMLSNFVGLVKLYRVTGEQELLKPVMTAWKDIVAHRLYLAGSTSQDEKFQDDDHFECSPEFEPSEGCVTTTWIQLNMQLYYATGDPVYIHFIENGWCNQLLAAENVKTGCVSYFTPMMEIKHPQCGVTCCLSSVARGISMLPEFVWGKYGKGLCINLYTAGSFSSTISSGNSNNPVQVVCSSDFPQSGNLSYTFSLAKTLSFPVYFRIPEWCTDFKATVNGKVFQGSVGSYLEINRKWLNNDKVTVSFNLPAIEIPGKFFSYPSSFAVQRGPQILAVDKNFTHYSPFHPITRKQEQTELIHYDAVFPKSWLGDLAFMTNWNFEGTSEPVILVPFAEAGQNDEMFGVWISNHGSITF